MSYYGTMNVTANNSTYQFKVYGINAEFPDVGGVYIFSKVTSDQQGVMQNEFLYIGETHSFKNRLKPSHAEWNNALNRGMNRISIYVPQYQSAREDIQNKLITAFQPPFNNRGL